MQNRLQKHSFEVCHTKVSYKLSHLRLTLLSLPIFLSFSVSFFFPLPPLLFVCLSPLAFQQGHTTFFSVVQTHRSLQRNTNTMSDFTCLYRFLPSFLAKWWIGQLAMDGFCTVCVNNLGWTWTHDFWKWQHWKILQDNCTHFLRWSEKIFIPMIHKFKFTKRTHSKLRLPQRRDNL